MKFMYPIPITQATQDDSGLLSSLRYGDPGSMDTLKGQTESILQADETLFYF